MKQLPISESGASWGVDEHGPADEIAYLDRFYRATGPSRPTGPAGDAADGN